MDAMAGGAQLSRGWSASWSMTVVPLHSFKENAAEGRTFPPPDLATGPCHRTPRLQPRILRRCWNKCGRPPFPSCQTVDCHALPPVARQSVKRSDKMPGAACLVSERTGLAPPSPQARHPPPDGGPFCVNRHCRFGHQGNRCGAAVFGP